MTTFTCYLIIVVIATTLMLSGVSGTTIVRSQNNNEGRYRVKGEAVHDQDRYLQEVESQKTKKHAGNILRTFDHVWTDASSVETNVKIKTTCKKPKKQKKSSSTTGDASVTGDGVVGGGSGKGGGKGNNNNNNASTNGSSNVNSVASSNTTTTTVTTNTANATPNTTSPTTSGTGNATNASTRSLQQTTNTTNSNTPGNQTSSSTTTTNNTVNNSNPNVVVTVRKGGKGGKGGNGQGSSTVSSPKKGSPSAKVSADEIPYCDEDNDDDNVDGDGSTAVNAPAVSPTSTVSAPSGTTGRSPTTATVTAPSVAIPSPVVISSPIVLPSNESSSVIVGEATVCEAYRFGAAPTDAPSQNHTTFITLNVVAGSDINSIYSQMGTVLREKIGPLLLDCVSERRRLLAQRRKQQENSTELVNVVFTDPTFTGESCSGEAAANTTCIPSMFDSEVYYYGEEPVDFGEKLRQAILFTDFNIPGLLSFGDVAVTENVEDADVEPTPTPAADRGLPPTTTSSIETTQRSKNGPSPGVSVAVAVSVLALVLAALFVVRRHREAKSSDSLSKHIEFTDDFPDDAGAETADDNSANTPEPSPPKSYVVSDQSLDESWNAVSRRNAQEGQEVYTATMSYDSRNRSDPQTSFVVTDSPDPRLMNLPPRFYETADTVNL